LLTGSPLLDGVDLLNEDPHEPDTVYCDVFSLPAAMGLDNASIATNPFPHLTVPPEETSAWRRLLQHDARPLVGIVWSSWAENDHRSVGYPFFDDLIAELPDILFVGLHSGFSKADLRTRDFAENFRYFGTCDLPTTKAILSALDLVIAPDGGLAHLSCALAKETWVLLTHHCDWRWRSNDARSEWYPTARLFRQSEKGNWNGVQTGVRGALHAVLGRCSTTD